MEDTFYTLYTLALSLLPFYEVYINTLLEDQAIFPFRQLSTSRIISLHQRQSVQSCLICVYFLNIL